MCGRTQPQDASRRWTFVQGLLGCTIGKLTTVYIPQRMVLTIKHKVALSSALLKSSLPLPFDDKMPEGAPTKTQLHVLSIIDQYAITCVGTSTIHPHSIKSSLPSLYITHVIIFSYHTNLQFHCTFQTQRT